MKQNDQPQKYTVNVTLLVVTAMILIISVPAIYFWHARSVSKLSESFLTQAQALVEQADQQQRAKQLDEAAASLHRAVEHLWQYRRVKPDDGSAAVLLARTYERSPQGIGNSRRAAELYADAIVLASGPERNELRMRFAEILLQLDNYAEAEAAIREIMADTHVDDADSSSIEKGTSRLLALAMFGQVESGSWTSERQGDEIGSALVKAIQLNPADTRLPTILGSIYRESDLHQYLDESQRQELVERDISHAQKADEILDSMVDRNRELAQAYVARHRYRQQYGIDGAGEDIQRAVEWAPEDPEINFLQGEYRLGIFQTQPRPADESAEALSDQQRELLVQTEANFQTCVQQDSNLNPLVYLDACRYLGTVQRLLGNGDDAIATWQQALTGFLPSVGDVNLDEYAPILAELYQSLVSQLVARERLDEATRQLSAMGEFIDSYSIRSNDPQALFELVQTKQYLSGVLSFQQGAYGTAIDVLEQTLTDQRQRSSRRTFDVIRTLGQIYLQLEQPSRAANIYQNAVRIDRTNREFRLLLSQARMDAGQYEMAAQALEPLARSTDSAPRWLDLADMYYRLESSRPRSMQNWNAFQSALQRARELNAEQPIEEPWRLETLDLNAQLAQAASSPVGIASGDSSRFESVLSDLANQASDNPQLIRQLVTLHYRIGQIDEAMRLLDRYESLAGDVAERYLFRADLLASQKEYAAAAETLANGLSRVAPDERLPIQLAQVALKLNQADFTAAISQLEKLATKPSVTPALILQLAELSIQLPDQISSQPSSWESELSRIEGPNGPYANYFAAQRAILDFEATQDHDERERALQRAEMLCQEALRVWPDWPAPNSLNGQIFELRSLWTSQQARAQGISQRDLLAELRDKAIRAYRRAFELGERRRRILYRLSALEIGASATPELLAQLDRQTVAGDPTLSSMQLAVDIANNDLDNARQLAQQATELRPVDPTAWISRARVELRLGDIDNFEKSLAKSRDLAGPSPNPQRNLLGIFTLYVTANQYSPDADAVQRWQQAARHLVPEILQLSDDQDKSLLHAEMLDALGDNGAARLFLEAEQDRSENTQVLERSLRYFRTHDLPTINCLDEAIRIATKLVSLQPTHGPYRQQLADLLRRRGGIGDWQQIEDLLANEELKQTSEDDQRFLAIMLLMKRDVSNSERLENLQQALSMVKDGNSTLDQILIGQLHHAWSKLLTGEDEIQQRESVLEQAKEHFVRAAELPGATAQHLFAVADFFIQLQDWQAAEKYIRQLRSILGESVLRRAPVVGLTARVMKQSGSADSEAVIEFVENFGRQIDVASQSLPKNTRARVFQEIANILESVDARPQAVVWREKAVNQDPRNRLRLGFTLASNGMLDQSLEQFIQGYQETNLPIYVYAITDLLMRPDCKPRHFQTADKIFDTAIQTNPNDVKLLVGIGNVRFAGENRIDDAIDMYERALKIDPFNLQLLNNLATMYAEIPGRLPEALQLIDRAIDKYGTRPHLVDTKAVILMLQGELTQAESMLSDIVNQYADSRFWWHLAEVNWRLYEKTQNDAVLRRAHSAFDQSIKLGLEQQVLTPGEKKRLATLRQNLDSHKLGSRQFPLSPLIAINLLGVTPRQAGNVPFLTITHFSNRCPVIDLSVTTLAAIYT